MTFVGLLDMYTSIDYGRIERYNVHILCFRLINI